jgi:hypothetical protein
VRHCATPPRLTPGEISGWVESGRFRGADTYTASTHFSHRVPLEGG